MKIFFIFFDLNGGDGCEKDNEANGEQQNKLKYELIKRKIILNQPSPKQLKTDGKEQGKTDENEIIRPW